MNDSEGFDCPPASPDMASATARQTLTDLQARFPQTPFLALGQTALWDEPTKAVLRRALDTMWPDAVLRAGAHDTDYFAKLPGRAKSAARSLHGHYALALHDDAKTRGLWSAAGEMSALFGAEEVVTQDDLRKNGTLLDRTLYGLHSDADARDALLSELTAAWGWTGIIYTEWDRKIARDVPLRDILPTLLDQVKDATDRSIACLNGERAARARETAALLPEWISEFARQNAEASLTDFYQDVLPRLYGLLLKQTGPNVQTTCTTELLRFNRETARLPRFALVDVFLNPITRQLARDAYNLAVGGSDIYTLDQFDNGALPFDLVIPGKGRGTLCIPGDGTIFVDTPRQPTVLCDTGCDFSNVDKLAALIERELGTECVLVGKAVTLIPMIAAENIVVFHETASGYTDKTRAMMTRLAARNIAPTIHPILRIKYSTWDALSAVPALGSEESDRFNLPPFLAQAFGRPQIAIDEFASCWRHAMQTEQRSLEKLRAIASPRQLLNLFAAETGDKAWETKKQQYQAASLRLYALRDEADSIQGRVLTLYDQVRGLKADADQMERAKGDDFRARITPLRAQLLQAHENGQTAEADALQARIDALQAERALTFDAEIASRRGQVRFALATVRELKTKRLALERGKDSAEARQTLRRIEADIERAHAETVRNALQTIRGLPHTDFRPSAWWFPLVDDTGSWFNRLAETAEFYLEPLMDERGT